MLFEPVIPSNCYFFIPICSLLSASSDKPNSPEEDLTFPKVNFSFKILYIEMIPRRFDANSLWRISFIFII